jgi:hypothetical protein
MKVKLNFVPKNLDGSDVTLPDGSSAVLSSLVANWIMNNAGAAKDIIKHFNWATELYKTGEIDLDRAGQAEFKDFILNLQGIPTLVKGIIVNVLDKKDPDVSSE